MVDLLPSTPLPGSPARRAPGVPTVVLAAGAGTRLRPVTDRLAKPLVPVLDVPLLYWTVAAVGGAASPGLIANVNAHAGQLRAAADHLRQRHGVTLRLVAEESLTGPAGGLVACRDELPDADCHLVVSGDAWTDVDFAAVVAGHRAACADLTIVATTVPDPWRFGVLELAGDEVTGMVEKPSGARTGAVVSCGMYVIGARALRRLDRGDEAAYDFRHVVPALLADGLRVRAHLTDRYWTDVGTVEALRSANLHALRHAPDFVARQDERDAGLWRTGPSTLDPTSKVLDTAFVGAGAHVGPGVVLERAVVGAGCVVGPGAHIRDSVLLPGAVVPAGRHLDREVTW